MRRIEPYQIKVGQHVHIAQEFASGGDRAYTGTVVEIANDYVTLDVPWLDDIDIRQSSFMPNVRIYLIKE